jgi:hypothetical protein
MLFWMEIIIRKELFKNLLRKFFLLLVDVFCWSWHGMKLIWLLMHMRAIIVTVQYFRCEPRTPKVGFFFFLSINSYLDYARPVQLQDHDCNMWVRRYQWMREIKETEYGWSKQTIFFLSAFQCFFFSYHTTNFFSRTAWCKVSIQMVEKKKKPKKTWKPCFMSLIKVFIPHVFHADKLHWWTLDENIDWGFVRCFKSSTRAKVSLNSSLYCEASLSFHSILVCCCKVQRLWFDLLCCNICFFFAFANSFLFFSHVQIPGESAIALLIVSAMLRHERWWQRHQSCVQCTWGFLFPSISASFSFPSGFFFFSFFLHRYEFNLFFFCFFSRHRCTRASITFGHTPAIHVWLYVLCVWLFACVCVGV